MIKNKRNIRIGLVFVITLVVFVLGLNFLKGKGIFFGDNRYHAYYEDINGLVESSPILYKGLKVGVVSKIEIDTEKDRMIVALDVRDDLPLGREVIAKIVSTDFLGSKAVRLENVTSDPSGSNKVLKGAVEPDLVSELNKRLSPLQKHVETLVLDADSTMTALNNILTPETQLDISNSISNLNNITRDLSEVLKVNKNHFNHVVANSEAITDSIKGTLLNVNVLIHELQSVASTLNNSGIDSLVLDLRTIAGKLAKGKGTAGKLLNEEGVYNELEKTIKGVNSLVEDFKKYPERYVQLSAVSLGRKVFLVDLDNLKLKSGISLAVTIENHLVKEENMKLLVDYRLNNKKDLWISNYFDDLSYARKEFDKIKVFFPSANLVAYKGKREVSLDKAFD
ncbi:MlaD family protein [Halosquirtibacter laminarini]|uniref:MlaD family protein n=1 Tax=Halosquirtibacter laminarini TaxID=3374600 RepID=A0AC61NCB2_9BACT|nr:MlaD family protein [Prolixibacteraceae bacterium]